MSMEYAENRIREALKQAGGSVSRAHQLVMTWAQDDPKLMKALARPHLNGIVAYNVDRVASGRAEKSAGNQQIDKPVPQSMPPGTQDFGLQLLKAIAKDNSPMFGMEGGSGGKRGKASQSHKDAITRIARGTIKKDD